jgi:phosphoribosyl 1,2-cyclic phosphodiesterase
MYVAGGGTHLLIDAGLGVRETATRLGQLGVPLESIQGVLFTHDHNDHCLRMEAWRRHGIPFYANEATASCIEQSAGGGAFTWKIFETGSPFEVGPLQVEPFSIPHDGADPVGFVISEGPTRLGIATDVGTATLLIRRKLSDCDALILETNHDLEMLQRSERPWGVIQRIRGQRGHLSNEDAAELLGSVLSPRLQTVFLAHLSAACNTPELAERAVRAVLRKAGREEIRLVHTHADAISERVVLTPSPA